MRCRQVQRWLRANGPAAAAPARVCAHLADCATCRATQERLHCLAALLETTTPPEPPAGLRGRVLGALPDRPLVGWWAPRLLPAAGLAAALVFVLAPRGPSPLEVGAAELPAHSYLHQHALVAAAGPFADATAQHVIGARSLRHELGGSR